ncbi:hypothetical protein [Nitrosomonas marina]|nr:hypothetical protein [Nitrosomonas marina]
MKTIRSHWLIVGARGCQISTNGAQQRNTDRPFIDTIGATT